MSFQVNDHVTVTQPDGVDRPGVIAAPAPGRPDFWIVNVEQDAGGHALTLHHESRITKREEGTGS